MEKFTVFVASPGDVMDERNALDRVINEINLTHGEPLNYELDLWRWEKNAFPSAEAPQELINSIITPYCIFVGIMWKRFGTPTERAGSGTEEEYRTAYKAWQGNNDIGIMFYFRKQAVDFNTEEEISQFQKVFSFRKELNERSLIWNYSDPVNFENEIRKHICLRMNRKMKMLKESNSVKAATMQDAKPKDDDVEVFKSLWPKMDADLQAKLSIAYNDNRMAGDGGIKTRDFFAAALSDPSEDLKKVIHHINDISADALPKPKGGALVEEQYIVDEQPWLSHCVASSLKRLSNLLPEGKALSSLDVFIDIARNGTGDSVQRMRDHNIGPEEIEKIIQTTKVPVIGF